MLGETTRKVSWVSCVPSGLILYMFLSPPLTTALLKKMKPSGDQSIPPPPESRCSGTSCASVLFLRSMIQSDDIPFASRFAAM